ncbi:MAG: hypothetical protein HC936_12510 [Leptolyngbyaceae cyanobacterium SU_3_3]|nr:hypothetical protein [Leptolyngbyaceae cyanobacterium SU_3_3]
MSKMRAVGMCISIPTLSESLEPTREQCYILIRPFILLKAFSLFSDHADPLQYYYLPMMPKLTTIADSVTGQKFRKFN